jgi:hypothetical protein
MNRGSAQQEYIFVRKKESVVKKKKPCRQKEEKILQGNCKGGTLNTL